MKYNCTVISAADIGAARKFYEDLFSEKLDEIECPVVILCGEKDTANLKAAQGMKAALPQAELHIVPGVGHEVNKCASGAIAALDSPLTKERLIALFLKGKKLAVL